MVSLYLLEMDHVKAIHCWHCIVLLSIQTNLDPQMRVVGIFRPKPACVIHMITPIDLAGNSCIRHGGIKLKHSWEIKSSVL